MATSIWLKVDAHRFKNLDLSVPRLSHKHMKASRTNNKDVNPVQPKLQKSLKA